MKKTCKTLLALLLTMIMLLSLAACGKKTPAATDPSDVSGSTTSESTTTQTQEATTTATKPAGGKLYASVEEYVNSPEMQKAFAALKESFSSMPMTMEMKGEDNKLVYIYTYTQDIDKAAAKPALENSVKVQAATFENVAKQMLTFVDEKNPVVKVVYLAKDGDELYSCEFDAK